MPFWRVCPCCEQRMRWQSGWHHCPSVLSDKLLDGIARKESDSSAGFRNLLLHELCFNQSKGTISYWQPRRIASDHPAARLMHQGSAFKTAFLAATKRFLAHRAYCLVECGWPAAA